MDLAELGIVYVSEGAEAAISKMAEFQDAVVQTTLSLDEQAKADAKLVSATESLSSQITRSIIGYQGARSAQYEFAAIAMGANEQLFKQIELLKTLEEMDALSTQAAKETAQARRMEQGALLDLARDIEHLNKVKAKEAQDAEAARQKELASREAYYSKIVADAKAAEQAITDAKHKAIVDQQNERDRLVAMYTKEEQERVKAADRANKQLEAANKVASDNAIKEAERKALSEISWAKKSREEQIQIKKDIATHQAAGISSPTLSNMFGSAAVTGSVKDVDTLSEKVEKVRLNTSRVRSEFVVLLHEAVQGRFSRIPASLMVFAEYADLTSLAMSGLGLSIMAGAAAVAVLGVALYKGLMEQRDLQNALIMTGNYAGTTAGALNEMAHSSVAMGGSLGTAKDIILDLASSGKFTASQIKVATDAIVAMEHATGGGDEIVKKLTADFKSLQVEINAHSRYSDELTKAVVKLDSQYHFLTTSTLAQIRALEDEGRTKEASAIATDEFAKATKERADEIVANLGSIERGWRKVKEAIGEAWSAVKDWGKTETPQDQLAAAATALAEARNPKRMATWDDITGAKSSKDRETEALVNYYAAVKRVVAANKEAEEQGERSARQTKANVAFSRLEIDAAQAKADALGKYAKEIREVEANLAAVLDSPSNDENSKAVAQKNATFLIAKLNADAEKAAKGTAPKAEHISAYTALSDEIFKTSQKAEDMLANTGKQTEAQRIQTAVLVKLANAYDTHKISLTQYVRLEDALYNAVEKLTIAEKANAAQMETDKEIEKRNRETEKAVEYNNKLIDSYEALKESYKNYVETSQRQADLKEAGLGAGNKRRAELSTLAGLEDKFTKTVADLEKKRSKDGEFWYGKHLTLAQETYAKEVSIYLESVSAMNRARRDWSVGAKEAYKNYVDRVDDTASSVETIFSDSFKNMEDSLTSFVTSGQLSWSSLEQTILQGITRIIIQQQLIKPMANYLNGGMSDDSGFGGFISAGMNALLGSTVAPDPAFGAGMGFDKIIGGSARAIGGPVSAGNMYQVNEQGPELLQVGTKQFLMMGSTSGTVTPNNQVSDKLQQQPISNVVNNHFTISGAVDKRTQMQIAASAASGAQRAMNRNS